jgi:uncharacterized membrane protein
VIAVLGLLGGFATPILLSTGENRPVALFAYVAMLDAGVVVLAYRQKWHSLLAFASIGSAVLYVGWAAKFLGRTDSAISLVAAAVLSAMFALPPLFGTKIVASAAPSDPLAELTRRAVTGFGTIAPFIAALVVASDTHIAVAPAFLVSYLALLSIGTAFVSARAELRWLPAMPPLLSLLAMTARLDDDLVPAHRTATLACFAVPAAVAFALYVVAASLARRPRFHAAPTRALRIGAGLAFSVSPALVARIIAIEPLAEPLAPLAAFIALHLGGLIALAAITVDASWLLVADGTSLVTLLALGSRHDETRTTEFAVVASLFILSLWSAPLVLGRRHRAGRLAWIASGVALITHFPCFYQFTRGTWPSAALAASALACAVLAVLTLRLYFLAPPGETLSSRGTVAALGAIALAFVTASVPIALTNQWITVAWAAEAAALAWLRRRVEHEWLVIGCALLAGATFIRLVANPWLWEYGPTGGIVVINWLLYAFGVPIAAFFAAARWLRASPFAVKCRLPPVLAAAAGVLAFVLMNAEIADAFAGTVEGGLRFSGQSVLEDMTYSLGWGLFALGTLVVGIARRSRGARAAALGVLVLTIAKVFLHDLWQLGSLYRVGSMIGLAVALLAVSFLLQRFVLRSGAEQGGQA